MNSDNATLRIDRWLHFCRFFKTRSKATAAVNGGHVRVNGQRATAGGKISAGDVVDLVRDRMDYKLTVLKIPPRRGPASEAAGCYEEDPDGREKREKLRNELRQDRLLLPRTDGRPDKHTRRALRARSRGD